MRYFFRGLLFVVPIALTVYILYAVFAAIEGLVDTEAWFGVGIPGLGTLLALAVITVVGMLASNVVTGWFAGAVDRLFQRVPIAKLIHGAIKDLLAAFVGDKRRFDRPVLVSLGDGMHGRAFGFVTREHVPWVGDGHVAVYFPQSYNFAGQVLIFPKDAVDPLDAEPSAVMQFIVSGGVSASAKEKPAIEPG